MYMNSRAINNVIYTTSSLQTGLISWFSPYPIFVTLCSIAPHLVVDEKQSDKLILTKV